MAQSYFKETFVRGKHHILNFTRHKRIKDKHLLTTDHGAWVALDKDEYTQVLRNEMSDDLFKLLEDKGIIITPSNLGQIIEDFKNRYHFLFTGTSLHIIVTTLRCNHKCIYCHSSAKHSKDKSFDLSKETAKKILEFIFQGPASSFTVEFQGGETLMNLDVFKYIVEETNRLNLIHKRKVRFALVSNLTVIDRDIIEYIAKNNVNVCTSLDGPEVVHDKNRLIEGNKPSYKEVTKWFKILKDEYKMRPSALMVTTRHSLSYWKEIVDEYVKWGIDTLQLKYINKLGFADREWERIGYTMDEFIEYWKKSVDYMIELNKKGIHIKERFVALILQKILTNFDPSFLDFRTPCGMVIGQMAYDYNGDVYTCDEGRNYELFKMGNVKENTYKEIVTSQKTQQLLGASTNDNYLCDLCVYKPYCGVCPVMSYAEEGNIFPKLAKNSRCKLYKFQFDYVFEKLLFDPEVRDILFSWIGKPKGNPQMTHRNQFY